MPMRRQEDSCCEPFLMELQSQLLSIFGVRTVTAPLRRLVSGIGCSVALALFIAAASCAALCVGDNDHRFWLAMESHFKSDPQFA